MPSFQTQVNINPAPGVEGDFCDHNPRTTVNAGPGGLVSGINGVYIGRFAWVDFTRLDPNNAPAICNSFGSGPPDGFVHREQQGIITNWLAASGMLIPSGLAVTLHNEGGFWVRNAGTGFASYGMKAFANLGDGSVAFAAAGAAAPGSAAITGAIAAGTLSVTGSIAGNVLTVTAVTTGPVVVGALITGSGVPAGTRINGQVTPLLSGETMGGIGRYSVNVPELSVPSTAITGTYGTLTVTVADPGGNQIGVGGAVTGATAGTVITARGTGAGGLGTYIVNNTQTFASGALTITGGIETKWFARSAGVSGSLIKISAWPYG